MLVLMTPERVTTVYVPFVIFVVGHFFSWTFDRQSYNIMLVVIYSIIWYESYVSHTPR